MGVRVMVVTDDAPARQRLRTLLGECRRPVARWVGEAADAPQAVALLAGTPVDVLLLDSHMPSADAWTLAHALRTMGHPPVLVCVGARADGALQDLDLKAVAVLSKPVRLNGLEQALTEASRLVASRAAPGAPAPGTHLLITERGRTERVEVADVVYFKAELKYVTVRTREREYVLDGSLRALERFHGARLLRVHRNALVARTAIQGLERSTDSAEPDVWWLKLHGLPERLAVSRRQLPLVREAMSGQR